MERRAPCDRPGNAVSSARGEPLRLAIVATHPIQYFSPWFQRLAARGDLSVRVFYLWDFGVRSRQDPGFQQAIVWDVPMLSGYDHEFVPNRSPWRGTHRFVGLWNPDLPERLLAFRPHAILMFGYNYATLMRLVLSRKLRDIPMLFRGDSHRIVARHGWRERWRRLLIGRVFKRFCGFLYVGAANRDYFTYHGVPEQKLFHAPHAVDNDRFIQETAIAQVKGDELRRSLGVPAEGPVVLFAGKFERKKRPLDLLRAFIAADVRGTSLLFVGAGELEADLRAHASGRSDVYFAPFQNQTMMPAVYCAADVMVLPSYGSGETWGLAVNEAMCMARAVIVSEHVGCARDLVLPERTGLVFTAGDVAALTACLRTALADMGRLRQWGASARELVKKFTYEEATIGLLSALSSCVVRK
jgi:glycosyltransferase involved in cell wall biosynthesis